jgi:hypothetical protein
MTTMNKLFPICGIGVLLFSAGCDQATVKMPPPKPVVPVSGKALFADGEPVQFALIFFEPKDVNNGPSASGFIDKDGKFSLRSYSNKKPDGAVKGSYLVRLEPYDPASGVQIPSGMKPSEIPQRLRKTATAEFPVEIEAEMNNLVIKFK